MSNERRNQKGDRLVTDTYKALASERAPDHLNEQVLRLAARNGRTRYSRARAWIRPMAWAATIGLSFAIVLELSRLPSIEPESVNIAVPDEVGAREKDLKIKDGEAADKQKNAPPPVTAPDSAISDERSRSATPGAERLDRLPKPDRLSKDEFVPQGMAVLREAEEMARAQAGPDQAPTAVRAETDDESAEGVATERFPAEQVSAKQDSAREVAAEEAVEIPAAASFAAVAEKEALRSGSACPLEVRESAESWFACIKTLRENGQEDLADSEYEEFQQIFPDFVDPRADK